MTSNCPIMVWPGNVSLLSESCRGLPKSYSVVRAGEEHLKAIPAIELAAASIFSEQDLPLNIRYRVTEADVLAEAQSDGRMWVVLNHRATAVGFAMLAIVDGLAHLDELDVHPDHSGQGIGSSLLKLVIDSARCEQYAAMTLVTFRHLAWNAPFYERFGFCRLGQDAMTDDLRDILEQEEAAGINVRNRVAMRLSLN